MLPSTEDAKEVILFKAAMKQGLKNFVACFTGAENENDAGDISATSPGLKHTRALAAYLSSSENGNLATSIETRVSSLMERSKKVAHTLIHGDVCNENMYIYNGGSDIMFVDFHLCRFGSCSVDVGKILALCVADGHQEKVEKEVLKHYHAELVKADVEGSGAKDYSFEQMVSDHKFMRHQYLVSLGMNGLKLPTAKKNGTGIFAANAETRTLVKHGSSDADARDLIEKFDYRSRKILAALQEGGNGKGSAGKDLAAELQGMPEDSWGITDLMAEAKYLVSGIDV